MLQHQDWNNITLNTNNKNTNTNNKNTNNKNTNTNTNTCNETKLDFPKELGKLIMQSRNALKKTQKELSNEIGISQQILSRWESGKEFPTNLQIANIEKNLKVKLPRGKKIPINSDL